MTTYQELRRQIEKLSPDDKLRLLEEITGMVRRQASPISKSGILALEGLGKDIWQGIDAQDYVNQERASWHG